VLVKASELAACLGVSSARVSQYVSQGKLDGCFHGEGRDRRFDLDACVAALGKQLHPGQMMTNGAQTKRILDRLGWALAAPAGSGPAGGGPTGNPELGRFELARTEKMEQEARRLRRDNDLATGTLVKASEVERQVQRLMAQEIAEFEAVLRDGARRIADRLGVDFRAARQMLNEAWREHREGRVAETLGSAAHAVMTEIEQEADY
jgi:hypothetical protein